MAAHANEPERVDDPAAARSTGQNEAEAGPLYPRHPGYPVSGRVVNPAPSGCGDSIRLPAGRVQGFRVPRMYNGGYRGFSYRGGLW